MGDHPPRPPSHRSLGRPLPYQPANGTHAHPFPPELYPPPHAGLRVHGVLIRLSAGYPPGMGRLHTRYAPVRRSPPVYCYTALPRDLHVLGLPLAFILSQDQTLRCIEDLLMLFCSLAQGLFCAIFPKKIYSETLVSLYACFPVLFISRYHRVKERADLSSACIAHPRPPPAACFTYSVLLYHPIPSDRERKGSNFFLSSNSFAKKKFFFFSAPSTSRRTSLFLQSGCKYRPSFFYMQVRMQYFFYFFLV